MRDICVLYGGLCVWVCVYVVRVYVRLCTSVCVCMRVHVTGGCKCLTDVRTYVYYMVGVGGCTSVLCGCICASLHQCIACVYVYVTGGCKCVTDVRTYVYYVVDVSIRVHMCVTSMYTHQCTHRQ
jgi:hypothetical protein